MPALTALVLLFDKIQFLGLAFLVFELLLLVKKSSRLLRVSRVFFWVYVGVVLAKISFLYALQFFSFNRYLLPPFRPLSYFLGYSWQQFGKEPVFAFLVGIFFFCLLWLLTKISQGRFFYEEEKYTGGLAVIANLWPQNILTIFLAFGLGAIAWLAAILHKQIRGGTQASVFLSLRVFWLAAGIVLLVFGQLLVENTFLNSLRL